MVKGKSARNIMATVVVILLVVPFAAALADEGISSSQSGNSTNTFGGIIGNTVWYDLDGDGSQDSGEVGIGQVTVYLYQGSCSGTPIATDVTDADGKYQFTHLISGDYCVVVDESTLPAPAYLNTAANNPFAASVGSGHWVVNDADFGYKATVCLPDINFEADDQGVRLTKGEILSDPGNQRWAAWGVTVSTGNHSSYPVMVFESHAPSGGDIDLGTPNEDFSGPGIGAGGEQGTPGENNTALGNIMIISTDGNSSNPNDRAAVGWIRLDFTQGLRVDQVYVLDIEENTGTVKAYDENDIEIKSVNMAGYGDNSFQAMDISATAVYRLDVNLSGSGGVPAVVFCDEDPLYDFGDLPDSPYPTTLASVGARHLLIPGGPILGSLVDAEIDGQQDPGAIGDDFYGVDDEDGVLPADSQIAPNQPFILSISGTAGAILDAWFDFDADGVLSESEHFRRTLTGSATDFGFLVPADVASNSSIFARFRVSTDGVSSPYGLAPDGEVEDYVFTSAPLSVGLGELGATADPESVLLAWDSFNELNIIGYNLERAASASGPWVQLNDNLIQGKALGQAIGASYEHIDSDVDQGATYYYRLVSLDKLSTQDYQDPIEVTVPTIGEPWSPPKLSTVYRVFLPEVRK